MKPVRVLTIAGSDSGGGAGVQADLKTITVLGGFGMSVITALTAQNTLGVQGIYEVSPDFVEKQFTSVMTDMGVDAAKTGMLANTAVLRVVAENIRKYNIEKLVVDPVMVAKGGILLIRGEFRETLIRELIPLACIVTPNIPEAEVLAEMKITSGDDMKKAARIIHAFGAKHVVVKGGHLHGDAVDVLYDGRQFHEFSSERIGKEGIHGTGCTFSAAIATGLAKGRGVFDAVKEAKAYITEVIRYPCHIGAGYGLINHNLSVMKVSFRP
jgi:hydroxymethylpyrimidine/phosphomethylpyrimidine kinase